MNSEDIINKLNKSYYNSNSIKELFKKIINNIITNFLSHLNRLTCNHNYKEVDKWVCNIIDNNGEILYTNEAYLHECRKCGKRIITGDFYKLTKSQKDWLNLWLKYEK